MYYRGAADAHYVPLCPIVIKPQHYVQEEVVYSLGAIAPRAERKRGGPSARRRTRLHVGSRLGLAGAVASILGPLASIPLVARVLFPRLTAADSPRRWAASCSRRR